METLQRVFISISSSMTETLKGFIYLLFIFISFSPDGKPNIWFKKSLYKNFT